MDDKKDEYEAWVNISKENYEKAKNILRRYFKSIYEKVGTEWTGKNDGEIEFVMDAISDMAFLRSSELVIKVEEKRNE